MLGALPFSEVWAVDFEFAVKDGGRPDPVCLVAYELMSGKKLRLWKDQFGPFPPYSVGPNSLFLAFTPRPKSAATSHWAGRGPAAS
jgi:DNA polymerase I